MSLSHFLKQTQKEHTISADHKKNLKAAVHKIDSQSQINIRESLGKKILCLPSRPNIEDLANQHKLDLSRMLSVLSKCAQKHQVDTANFRRMSHRLKDSKVRHHQDNDKEQVLCSVDNFLNLLR